MVITKKLKLIKPNKEKSELLYLASVNQTKCINFWIEKIQEIESTNISELQKRFYQEAREKYKLTAAMTQLAEFTAVRIARISKKKRLNCPFLKKEIISVNQVKIDGKNISFLLGNGRTWFPFSGEKLPDGEIRESKIKNINGEWYCFLSIEIKDKKLKTYKKTLGVDMGVARIAVMSDTKGNNNKFFRGEPLRSKRSHYYNLRKRLQPKIKQGNVYKLLKRVSSKESNWMTDTNHKISREIVNYAKDHKMNIAIENLSGIRERIKATKKVRRMLHSWSFRQLADFLQYKAHLAGLQNVSVDPRETSKMCSKCGYVSRSNRKSQSRFKCNNCGYETNADRNGAINIAKRATESLASQ